MSEIIEDVGATVKHLIRTRYRNQRNAIICFAIAWYAGVGLLYYFKSEFMLALDGFQIVFFGLPVIIWIAWYATIKSKVADLFMQQFADANGYIYEEKGDAKNIEGTLFQIGHSKKVEDIVSGIYEGHPLRLFTYHYNVGSGKREKTYSYMVFELTFDTMLPRILVRSKDQSFGSATMFGSSFDHPNEIKLEGNFGDHYEFGVDKQYEIEALQIFTPDFMAHLIDMEQKFSMELVKKKLFIYSDEIIEQRAQLQHFYEVAKWFSACLAPILPGMKKGLEAMEEAFTEARRR